MAFSHRWTQPYMPASEQQSSQTEYAPAFPPQPNSMIEQHPSRWQTYILQAGYTSEIPQHGAYTSMPSPGDYMPTRPHGEHVLSRPSGPSSWRMEYAPTLPPRPHSAQPDYAPVQPPRPYNRSFTPAASIPASTLDLPLPYTANVTIPSAASPQPYYSTPSQPEIIAPHPSRPFSLPRRPRWNSTASSTSTLIPKPSNSSINTDSSTTDLLSANDIRILEEGISAIAPPKRSRSRYPPLTAPIAIPQLSVRSRLRHVMPFARAHAPVLTDMYDISPADFVRMIDTLNVCVAAAPPFQALHVAALGIGMVPEPTFIGIALGLDVVASAGTRTTRYFRLKRFLEKMNREVWAPRGLEMKVLRDPAVVKDMLGMDETQLLADMGQLSENTYQGVPEPLSIRRLRLLGSRVAEVDFDVPPSEAMSNIMDKISAKNQAWKAERKKRRLHKRQLKHDAKLQTRKDLAASPLGVVVPERTDFVDSEKEGESSVERREAVGGEGVAGPAANHGQTERVRSNAMEYADSSSASSDSDDEVESARATKLKKAIAKAEAKAAKINARADEKLNPGEGKNSLSVEKAAKVEQERERDLEKVQKELDKVKEELKEKREKRLDKRKVRNGKRIEKVGKRMQRLEWVVVVNLEEKEGDEQGSKDGQDPQEFG